MEIKNFESNENIIESVEINSIAEELEIEAGDILISINGNKIHDIIDYKYYISDDFINVEIKKKNGDIWELEIEKDYDEDIGIVFTNPLIDKAKSCRNKCIFCFIDQLPKGMRNTLYFKDDDSRLSFLQGNFITLTNLNDEEIERIIKYRISPINVSVHTTDPDLRIKMLNNKNAGKLFDILKKFNKANIQMSCQIVLVPDVNDGENLNKTLNDLSTLYPNINSIAVVPVGITKFREGLFNLNPYNEQTSKFLLDFVHRKQHEFLKRLGTRFVFASDEFYILAKSPLPVYEDYEGFPQFENGVGLLRSFYTEVTDALNKVDKDISINKSYIIVTGTLAYEFMKDIRNIIMQKVDDLNMHIIPVKNEFFGENITVSGLITGQDIIKTLKNVEYKGDLLIPKSMLKSGEHIFLDNVSVSQIEKELGRNIIICDIDGYDFIKKVIN